MHLSVFYEMRFLNVFESLLASLANGKCGCFHEESVLFSDQCGSNRGIVKFYTDATTDMRKM